jgi:hypothetical protein
VEESKKAFEELLARTYSEGEVSIGNIADIMDFLRSTADEPAAHNIARMVEWLTSRPVIEDVADQLSSLIMERLQSRTMENDEVSSVLVSLAVNGNSRLMAEILDHRFEKSDLRAILKSTTRMMLDRLRPHPLKPAPAPVLLWLQHLRECGQLATWQYTCNLWREVYHELSVTYKSPTAIGAHLALLSSTDLSRILLKHWVPHMLTPERGLLGTEVESASETPSLEILTAAFTRLRKLIIRGRKKAIRQNNPLIDLFVILRQHGLAPTSLARDVFEIYNHKRPEVTFKFFRSPSTCGTFCAVKLPRTTSSHPPGATNYSA